MKKQSMAMIQSRTLPSPITVTLFCALIACAPARADDWAMLGRDKTRNAVSSEKQSPLDWNIGAFDRKTGKWNKKNARHIKWTARLGSTTFGTPVVADGHVYIGTNNGGGYLKRYPSAVDLGCILCFRESDGEFLWQFSAEKLPSGRIQDWPTMGLGSTPLVEGDRMWFVSNRYELICLDTQGFRDGKNDGPYVDEPVNAPNEADVVWRYDLIGKLGVFPHNAGMGPNRRCSPAASYKNRIYIVTGNGPNETHSKIPAPEAPSLVCFDKDTGKVLWSDASPGKNILHSQVADPLVVEIGGRGQVIVPQGDGWIRSFDAVTGKLIWKFDMNFKESKWELGGRGARNNILATPVHYKGRVYVGSGQEMEHGDGSGRLVCIDPTKTGDISSELAIDAKRRPLAHRRIQAVDPKKGEKAVPNPNSGLIWEYMGHDHDGNGKIDSDEEFHRTVSSVVVRNNLLVAVDSYGLVHCLHAQTGERHWEYDALAAIWSSPLIVGDYAYVADEDGDVSVFRLSSDPKVAMKKVESDYRPIAEMVMDSSVYSHPIFSNGVLYIASRSNLFAITAPKSQQKPAQQGRDLPRRGSASDKKSPRATSSGRVPKPIFAPTPQDVVEAMLNAAGVKQNDTVVDLGSGDGRIVIAAAKRHGAKAVGYEIDLQLVHSSRDRANQAGLAKLVEIKHVNLFNANLSEARVVTAFLYPVVLDKLKPQFGKMKPGSWIVSHHYEIPETKHTRVVEVGSRTTGNIHRIFMYKTPLTRSQKCLAGE